MSKKKLTLKDLDDFLKQQAASLVEPEKLSEAPAAPVETIVQVTPVQSPNERITLENILEQINHFSQQKGAGFRPAVYELFLKQLETHKPFTPEDRMLINTILYLKSGDNWKEVIKGYWTKNK
jgi:hypothetical protein